MHHNDYTVVVRQYLTRYKRFTTYVENVKADIADYEQQLAMTAAPKVPVLSPSGGGGRGQNISQEEREFMKKEEIEAQIQRLRQDIAKIEPVLNRLRRSLDALSDTDRDIVTRRMIHNESWRIIASDNAVSEGYCRRRLPKIMEILAGMMFGPKAMPIQTELVFLEEDLTAAIK